MSEALSDFDRAFLYGDGHSNYHGLLPSTASRRVVPETMTRQRRRAAERAQAKGNR